MGAVIGIFGALMIFWGVTGIFHINGIIDVVIIGLQLLWGPGMMRRGYQQSGLKDWWQRRQIDKNNNRRLH